MNIAAILIAVGTTPKASREWVAQSSIVGKRYVVRFRGKGCGRSRFFEARRFHTPWRHQAEKFEDKAEAEALTKVLEPAEDQSVDVRLFGKAWHEEVLDSRWDGWPKIGPTMPDHRRPLLELVRLYVKALKRKVRPGHIIPAAPALTDPVAIQAGSLSDAGDVTIGGVLKKLHAWRKRLQIAGLPTTTLLIVEGTAADRIATQTEKLGSRVIAIGAQYHHKNRLLGGFLLDDSTQELLRDASCPVLISETAGAF